MNYEIGKFYKVPCVRGEWGSCKLVRDWPVMGSLHDDAGIIKFPWKHYHIDWRFVSERLLDSYEMRFLHQMYARPLMVWPQINPSGLPAPAMRRRKFYREHELPYDMRSARVTWMPELEREHATCTLAKGHICPHRGYDLTNEKPDASGIVTCPLHGLRWNMATGELVPRDVRS